MSEPERLQDEYFFVAAEYYIAGRFAFWANLFSVCGNLLHHAIELFLKGHLSLTMTREELTDLRHDLPRIWQRFKDACGDGRLTTFDRTITYIHAFEELRYPEPLFEKGAAVFLFTVTRADLDRSRAATRAPGHPPRYMLALEEVDQLVLMLLRVCSRDPEIFLHGRLSNPDSLKYLAEWPE